MDSRRVHSFFIDLMNRSMTATPPYFPTAPNLRSIFQRSSHASKRSAVNCRPWSVIMCFGRARRFLLVRSRTFWTSAAEGSFLNVAVRRARRE
jgi:hypothetical protein